MKFSRKIVFFIFSVLMSNHLMSQNNAGAYMRIARIVVDPAQLESYKAALKEGITTAIKKEPGVLSISAVYEKDHPTNVMVLETYADENAYKSHIQSPHFLKYKNTVKHMIKSLELVDVSPIVVIHSSLFKSSN